MLPLLAGVEVGLFARMPRTRLRLRLRIGGACGRRGSFSTLTRLHISALGRVTSLDIRPLLRVTGGQRPRRGIRRRTRDRRGRRGRRNGQGRRGGQRRQRRRDWHTVGALREGGLYRAERPSWSVLMGRPRNPIDPNATPVRRRRRPADDDTLQGRFRRHALTHL
ncbi:MAG TPA: hypothetical protein VES00_19405, partial [Burkholderiaceae bacterium]|nr:hypothetical protein [Burkholderiaceae bacterium]